MISKDEIKHVAKLARLELSALEVNLYSEQLSKVLDYVNELEKVDTSKIDALTEFKKRNDFLRTDEVFPWDKEEIASALKQAKGFDGRHIKVNKVS